jgi:exopolysaccharide production protein ExoZ
MASPSLPRNTVPLTGSRRQYMSLQAGRGLAALLVVLHHVGLIVGHDPRLWNHSNIYRWMMGPRLGVVFFFVLSGMVILTAHWKDIDCPSSTRIYLWKRFRRIYPIYWLVLAFVLVGQCISVNPQAAPLRNPFVILSNILLVHIHSSSLNLLVAWTLFHEVMFYTIFAVVILNKRLGSALLVLWLTTSLLNFGWTTLPENLCSPLHLLFGMGMVSAWFLRQRKIPRPGILFVMGSLVFAGSMLYTGWIGQVNLFVFLSAGLGTALALLGAAAIEKSQWLNIPRWADFLGEASYSIYLIHFPIITIFGRICFRLDSHLHWPVPFWMFLLLCIGTIAGCLLHIFIERPLLSWLGGLFQPIAPLSNRSVSGVDAT